MKRKHKRPALNTPVVNISDFLREIDRVLPTIKGAEHRAVVLKIQSLYTALCYSTMMGDLVPRFSITEDELQGTINTLRCCGIAPPGWPQPPGPDVLLVSKMVFKAGWGESDRTGGTKA